MWRRSPARATKPRMIARQGVTLDDGPVQPTRVDARKLGRDRWEFEVTITEGRKREVRRLCSALGLGVERLVRTRFGPVELGDVAERGDPTSHREGTLRSSVSLLQERHLICRDGVGAGTAWSGILIAQQLDHERARLDLQRPVQHVATQVSTAADSRLIQDVARQVARRVVGQDYMVDRLLISLLTGGHVLLEGVPGLAKTLTVRTLAETIDTTFHRIQFTPDLLPADVLGTQVYDQSTGQFSVKRGPIFANIILADEINRAPAKVQAALLEAMQEKQVTIGGTTFKLEEPFLVLATQNPIEQEGTYPLPEAQVDRFMLKLRVGYPSRDEEKEIMRRMASGDPIEIDAVAAPQAILDARHRITELYMDDRIVDYIVDIVHATREPAAAGLPDLTPLIEFGASPRATIALAQASRAHAFLRGRAFVTPDDVKAIAPDVLRHRVLTTYEAEAEEVTSDQIVQRVLAKIESP